MLNTQNQTLVTIAYVHVSVVAPIYMVAVLFLKFVCQIMLHFRFMFLSLCFYVNVYVCVCVFLCMFSMFL